jgi:DNA polymerase
VRVTIDFETRSAYDIKYGAYRYAQDPSTEIMCLAILFDGETAAVLWHPAYPSLGREEQGREHLERLFGYVKDGCEIEAHNSQFERAIWQFVGVARLAWPAVHPNQWRCSSALAATFSLPRSLDGASQALGLVQEKDKLGHKTMMKLCKPRAALKADLELVAEHALDDKTRWKDIVKPKNVFVLKELYDHVPAVRELSHWKETDEDLDVLFDYCKQDVVVEHGISKRLGYHLPEKELKVWQLDQKMNATGIQIDMDMVAAALKIADECKELADARISELTDGAVKTVGQRQAFMDYINGEPGDGFLPNTQKATIEDALKHPKLWSSDALEALQLRQSQAKTSIKKYVSMYNVVGPDGRARGLLAYHGADTGRWAGRLLQPQNFPRGSVKEDIDVLCDAVLTGDREYLDVMYGDPMEVMSSALRGAMTSKEGYDLICADYSSIEARGIFWLVGDESALETFRQGRDIYVATAAEIYGIGYDEVKPDQRQMGKQAVLGLGYQMGYAKFAETCQGYGMDVSEELAKQVVETYRSTYSKIKSFWREIEEAAKEAVGRSSDHTVFLGKLKLYTKDEFLHIELPSGRCLRYYQPRVSHVPSRFNDWTEVFPQKQGENPAEYEERQNTIQAQAALLTLRDFCERLDISPSLIRVDAKLTFMGQNSMTRKYTRQNTYGGKLTENVVQALSRDMMAEAMLAVDQGGLYLPLLTVHDEIVAEVPEGQGSVKEFEDLISVLPEWADGFPLAAEGWRGKRYRK